MGKEERRCLGLIRKTIEPARIYEFHFASLSKDEWAASVAIKDGNDLRFRFTRGTLIDEATIGDARV